MDTGALYKIRAEQIKGTFYRYIRTKYGAAPMSTYGSFLNGGRYNVAGLFAGQLAGAHVQASALAVKLPIQLYIDGWYFGAVSAQPPIRRRH